MKINLSKLLDGKDYKLSFEERLENININFNGREFELMGPVLITGDVFKTEDDLYLNAEIIYEYRENCSRCLKEFNNKVKTVLTGRIVEESRSEDIDQSDEEFMIVYNGKEINIEDAVINSILLSLPMKPLCSENCRGLCPNCGKDLNEGQCNCVVEDIDPRLAKLKELFE